MQDKIYAYNQEQWENISEKRYFSERELNVIELKNGLVLPSIETEKKGKYKGGVCDSKFNFVAGFLRNGIDPSKDPLYYGLNTSYSVAQSDITYCNETVIFGGVLVGHFGHFILESMGRLWYHIQNPNLPYKVVFITVLEQKKWFYDFFRLLGLDEARVCFVESPMKYAKIIIPEESVHSWNSYTKEYLFPYEKIKKNVVSSEYKKVYLTRTQFNESGAICCNEEYFEDFYMKKGFKVIAPEKLSIEEQIGIVYGADEIVTTLGSISHFALFCKPNTKFTILTRVDDDVLPAQCLVNEASKVDWYIVDVSQNFLYANRVAGVNQIGATDYWKEYVRDIYEEVIEDNTLLYSSLGYLKKWCAFYANPYQFSKIKNIDLFDFYSRMARVLCGIKLDNSKFDLGKTKKELQNEIENHNVRIKDLEAYKSDNIRKDKELQLYREIFRQFDDSSMDIVNSIKWLINRKNIIKRLKSVVKEEQERPLLVYELHIERKGWISRILEGETAWENVHKLQIEAVKIEFEDKLCQIFYATYCESSGWSAVSTNGEVSGSTGKHMPLTGIKIWFGEEMCKKYDVSYRLFNSMDGWNEWKLNGEENVVKENTIIETLEIRVDRKRDLLKNECAYD